MRIDGHVHIDAGAVAQKRLLDEMRKAGVDGACLMSLPPSDARRASDRIGNVLSWTKGRKELYPFFWIDPTAEDAARQVEQAVISGVVGFKVICSKHAPDDPRAMATYHAIAERGKPILFHSGILWDGRPSSAFNRPAAFECLLEVPRLRFSLAHMSWPWLDECVAVYGKFLRATISQPEEAPEMFVDLTPGTPPIYREEALTKLFTVGYDVADNVIFGTDTVTSGYNVRWSREWQVQDEAIMNRLRVGSDVVAKVFGGNLLRWLDGTPKKRPAPKMGE